MKKSRRSDYELHGFVFRAEKLTTPILNHYFKDVYVDPFYYHAIKRARRQLNFKNN